MVQANPSQRSALPDKVISYASVFSYNPKERIRMQHYKLNEGKLKQFESKWPQF
jgi:hypothetical protein